MKGPFPPGVHRGWLPAVERSEPRGYASPGSATERGKSFARRASQRSGYVQAMKAKILTKLNAQAWNGDPSIQPPPLTKPKSSGSYGECPDDQELPWHLRQKRKP